jgi:hypothetical protein
LGDDFVPVVITHGNWKSKKNHGDFNGQISYPLVNIQKAIENGNL